MPVILFLAFQAIHTDESESHETAAAEEYNHHLFTVAMRLIFKRRKAYFFRTRGVNLPRILEQILFNAKDIPIPFGGRMSAV